MYRLNRNCKSVRFEPQGRAGDVRDSGEGQQSQSVQGVYSRRDLALYYMVIGNVLSGDSYHSRLSEAGTLVACGEGCLKFSGEV